MIGKSITLCLVIVGLINLAPVLGVISAQRLETGYSLTLAGNDIAILMRHRALLFGILGAFILFSAFNPIYQLPAMIMGGVSMVGFAWLAVATGGYNDAVAKVLLVDIVGILVLVAAAVLKYVVKSS
ncbi:MAG: hypothetical protein ABJN62_15675 [Halioglobus sp.]